MIAIVSYGVGNVQAFANIYSRRGIDVAVTASPRVLEAASHIILPGVGSFDWAMAKLDASGLRPVLDDLAKRDRPILGVCVGMQMMFQRSEEGKSPGLGWMSGDIRRFDNRGPFPLPHMGWNHVHASNDPMFREVTKDSSFYFLHSFYADPADAIGIARTDYGGDFTCAVRQNHVVGVQFHPEKSHGAGERLLLNFITDC